MTDTSTRPEPGSQIHFLESGFSFSTSDGYSGTHVSRRGQVVTVTAALIEASLDRNGDSWLDLAADPEGQLERWGKVMFALGEFPSEERLYIPYTFEWEVAREVARKAAHALPDGEAKAAAFRKFYAEFGPRQTSKTLQDHDRGREHGDQVLRRAAEVAAERIDPATDSERAAEAREALQVEAEAIRRQRALTAEEV